MPSVTVDRATFQKLLQFAAMKQNGSSASAAANEAINEWWDIEGQFLCGETVPPKRMVVPSAQKLPPAPATILSFPNSKRDPKRAVFN